MAVFAKELTFEGKSIPIQTKDEGKFISASIPLFQSLSKEIANAYLSGDTDKDAIAKTENKTNRYYKFEGYKNKQLETMKINQMKSFQALTTYQNNLNQQELIKAQDSLLSYLKEINKLE